MKYKRGKKDVSSSLYSSLPETLETLHAKEASDLRSDVSPHLQHLHLSVFLFLMFCLPPAEVQGRPEGGSGLQPVPPAA